MLANVEHPLKFLERCTSLKTLKQIHAQIFLNGHRENYAAVKLVYFCSRTLGNIGYSRMVFNSFMSSANVFLWTAMITGYTNHQSELTKEAILIFKTMHQCGPHPNNFTLSSVLKACSFLKATWEGTQVHANATKLGFNSSIYVQTTLVDMYAKFGWILESRHQYEIMHAKNVVAHNAMIGCYIRLGDTDAAREIFDKISFKDSISLSIMISGYTVLGNTSSARQLFDQMPIKEIGPFNALIAGYSHCWEWHESVKLFNDIRRDGVKPNHVTMAILMSTCSHIGALKVASQFHGLLHKLCTEANVYVLNSLVDMYFKCGSVYDACRVFTEMPVKDVVSYNVMITGFANHGLGEFAIDLFPDMLRGGVLPDTVTFLGILNACSQAGLLDAGCQYFSCMSKDYAVEPSADHYACMVDLFGRAGLIEEAYDLVRTMSVEPHAGVWGALLNACRVYRHIKIGKVAAGELFKIEPENPGNYVLLSNIYARAHLWHGVSDVRCLMRGRSVTKPAGRSWIEVNTEMEEFLLGDTTHPQYEEIFAVLQQLFLQSAVQL